MNYFLLRAEWRHIKHDLSFPLNGSYYNIFNFRNICHHYTTLESFWKIIESDTFRATHVRFSNDSEEYTQGKQIINSFIDKNYRDDSDHFVICLCKESNILSQWREYGQVGVSIGMDFSRTQLFTIKKNEETIKKGIKDEKVLPACPIDVLYVDKCDGIISECLKNDKSDTCSVDCEAELKNYNFENVNEGIKFGYTELKNRYESEQSQKTHGLTSIYNSLIPYIKHHDFKEEKEARLLFSISKCEESKYVEYCDVLGFKRPFINVKFGRESEKSEECKYIQIGDNVDQITKQAITDCISKTYPKMNFDSSYENPPKGNNLYIAAGNNQEEVFRCIDNEIKEKDKSIKIWCEGHWPIREIKVGPTNNKEQIAESISHYCENHYWLKYVDISYTRTPYREKKQLR